MSGQELTPLGRFIWRVGGRYGLAAAVTVLGLPWYVWHEGYACGVQSWRGQRREMWAAMDAIGKDATHIGPDA